jgi:NADH-quinone oxidoreductase subunit G
VAERAPVPYVMLNNEDALEINIQENELLSFEVDAQVYRLPVRLNPSMAKGMAGLPYGLKGLPFVELPEWGIIKKQ